MTPYMQFITTAGLAALLLPAPALGLIGYGISMYDPTCAFACRSAISGLMLSCSHSEHHGSGMSHHGDGMTTPACRAEDTPFLTTLAYCINSTCASFDITAHKLEDYWYRQASGSEAVFPKWTYQEALVQVAADPPTANLSEIGEVLNITVVVEEETWAGYYSAHKYFEISETTHSTYGIILLVIGFSLPILIALVTRLPYMTALSDKVKPYFVYPSLIGTYCVRPLPYLIGNAPTMGHAIYILIFLALNIAFAAAGYIDGQPNSAWWADAEEEVLGYFSARTGVLAFALAPLVLLFAGRNNFLLIITGWSHGTYLLLHRWVARLFTLQAVLHSVAEYILYVERWGMSSEQHLPYWVWGIVSTLAACIMMVVSSLWFRRKSYEIFLIGHIILAIFVLVGAWYHIELLFQRKWGYELWLYTCFGVWFFDRAMRVLRIAKTGARKAVVMQVTQDIYRVDVAGVRWTNAPGYHAYAYFPSLAPWRPWENHPFSVIPTVMLTKSRDNEEQASTSSSAESPIQGNIAAGRDTEKAQVVSASISDVTRGNISNSGVTFYIRKGTGLTKALAATTNMSTYLEGPYASSNTCAVMNCDRLVLISGGIGITGILSFIPLHPNVKVCWSVRDSCQALVSDLEHVLRSVADKEIRVGRRIDIAAILAEEEKAGWERVGVVVCGPGGLCDDTRAEVVRRGKSGPVVWELEVNAFSW